MSDVEAIASTHDPADTIGRPSDSNIGDRSARTFGVIASLTRLVVGVFFLMAAGAKVVLSDGHGAGVTYGLSTFAAVIASHHIIPSGASYATAVASVALEVALGLWLLSHRHSRWAAIFTIAFMGVFCLYLIAAYLRVGDAPCGCLGKLMSSKLTDAILRNAALSAMLLPSLVTFRRGGSLRSELTPSA